MRPYKRWCYNEKYSGLNKNESKVFNIIVISKCTMNGFLFMKDNWFDFGWSAFNYEDCSWLLLRSSTNIKYIFDIIRWTQYRVEQQTLPVEFLFNFYRMLQDMNLKICPYNSLVLYYDMDKACNIDSALVSVMTKIKLFSIMLKNCHIFYVHELKDFYFS